MALVIEDGTGKADAESYVSVADADTYLTARYPNTLAWFALAEGAKEQALRLATDYVDTEYTGRWIGTRKTSTQALEWPRIDALDIHGFIVASRALPQKLKTAVIEAARLMTSGGTLRADAPTAPIKRTKIGPLEKEYQDGVDTTNAENPVIGAILKGLISGGRYNVRVELS